MLKSAMRQIKKIHLVGIGGTGMGGIAEVLHNLGYHVTGSDQSRNAMVKHLKSIGIQIFDSHQPQQVHDCDVVVVSSAIPHDNIELQIARERRIPIVGRAAMLAELMRFKEGIAIAGTHGKTTTTSLVASILAEAKLDPTFVIGGKLNSLGSNAKLGQGQYFVAEADESDASFHHLNPMMSVVTNIDRDHLCTYQDDFSILKEAFLTFIHQLPFYGLAVVCLDDENIQSLLPSISRPMITYGFSEEADVRAIDFSQKANQCTFKVLRPNQTESLPIKLNLPGRHNVQNALAAIAIATACGVEDDAIQKGLEEFQGIGRRFEKIADLDIDGKTVTLLDDYGHHPREVDMVIQAAKQGWPDKRVVMIYQPHRYSRTKSLFEDFSKVLSKVDVLLLLDVYSAGEAPIAGADSRALCGSIRQRGQVEPIFIEDSAEIPSILEKVVESGDMLITQGAGDVNKISKSLAKHFANIGKMEALS